VGLGLRTDIFAAGEQDQLATARFLLKNRKRCTHSIVVIGDERFIQKTRARLLLVSKQFENSETNGEIQLILGSPAQVFCGSQFHSTFFTHLNPEIRVDFHLFIAVPADGQKPVFDRPVQLGRTDLLLKASESANPIECQGQRLSVQGKALELVLGGGQVFFDFGWRPLVFEGVADPFGDTGLFFPFGGEDRRNPTLLLFRFFNRWKVREKLLRRS